MLLVYVVWGVLIVLFLLNMFSIKETVLETHRYGYMVGKNEEQIHKELEEKYGRYLYRNEYNEIQVIKRGLHWGFSDGDEADRKYIIKITLIIFFLIFSLAVGIVALVRIGHESEALQKQNEYNIITKQVERIQEYGDENYVVSGDFGSLEDVYTKVTNYNNWVIRNQYWSENEWLWFWYNQYSKDLELIDLYEREE